MGRTMMNINQILGLARSATEWTYDKIMDVYGAKPYTKPNGSDGVEFGIVSGDVPCRLSINKRDNTLKADANLNTNSHIVFCNPEVEILPGSKVTIDGVKYQSTEESMIYPSHQEVKVNKYEWN